MNGSLFLISAPSGAGKSTLVRRLLDEDVAGFGGLEFSVSHTTRAPRKGEVDGREYHFVAPLEFERLRDEGRFLEWATVHDNLYGTSADEVDPRLRRGADVLLDIDVQGAEQVLAARPETVSIFVLPPSRAELERRLRRRGLDDTAVIERRLQAAGAEMARVRGYRYAIVNDDVDRAHAALAGIILERRHRSERTRSVVERILSGFQTI